MTQQIKEVTLDKLIIGCNTIISEEMGREVNGSWRDDFITGEIILMFRSYVYAEAESLQEKTVKYPSNWWQAFKDRWFPEWLLEKYPVDIVQITLKAKCLYPDFVPAIPDHKIRIAIFKE